MIFDANGNTMERVKVPPVVAQVPQDIQKFENHIVNSLSELTGILSPLGMFGQGYGAPVSQTATLFYNNRADMISNNRTLLTYMYVEHGIVQTLVDQPVDDAFRAGFEIKTGQLSGEEIEKLEIFCEQERVIDAVMQGIKWSRLYGGGGTLVATDQDPAMPLNVKAIREDTPLAFIPFDLWELNFGIQNMYNPSADLINPNWGAPTYNYYGVVLNSSRVYPIRGKQAPSFLRPRFLGWGMSELERLVRSLNQYLKNQDLIFELLDEAKIDVYRIKGFTQALMTANGTSAVANRIQHANMLKNFNHALTMDINDEYEQKQMAFTGLAEMLEQIRMQVAADLKMPITKLFGVSAAGFSSGEDDIENYNSMIEGEVRSKCKFLVVDVLKLCCQKLFGFVPDDLQIQWNPLRILSAEQEEKVKTEQHNRLLATFTAGLCTDEEAKLAINKASLLPIELDPKIAAELPLGEQEQENFTTEDEEQP